MVKMVNFVICVVYHNKKKKVIELKNSPPINSNLIVFEISYAKAFLKNKQKQQPKNQPKPHFSLHLRRETSKELVLWLCDRWSEL